MNTNTQSLLNNLDEINLIISERKIDILCISESWLLAHTPDSHVNIPNTNFTEKMEVKVEEYVFMSIIT